MKFLERRPTPPSDLKLLPKAINSIDIDNALEPRLIWSLVNQIYQEHDEMLENPHVIQIYRDDFDEALDYLSIVIDELEYFRGSLKPTLISYIKLAQKALDK